MEEKAITNKKHQHSSVELFGLWNDLPEDLLYKILSEELFLDDVVRFNSVCRSWRSVTISNTDPINSERSPVQFPVIGSQWLVQKHPNKLRLQFFHPVYSQVFELWNPPPIPESPSTLQFSKDGWLVFFQGDYSIIFANPFTGTKVTLPALPYVFETMNFVSKPDSPDFRAVCIQQSLSYMITLTIGGGEEQWNMQTHANNLPFVFSGSNPVFHKDKCYCLGEFGKLGVFDIKTNEWTVLSNPEKRRKEAAENYLLSHKGELLAVLIGEMGLWISVLKLDESRMEWEEVTDLGDNMLFVSPKTSFSAKRDIAGMENKIYLPRFYKGYMVCYSLDTRKYRTLRNDFSSTNLAKTEERLESSWMEPSAHQ